MAPKGKIKTIAQIVLPDGTLLNTSDTTTSGLQEAFDYAGNHNLDVLVFGRGIENKKPRVMSAI